MEQNEKAPESEQKLITHLRQEARDIKQCFTTYSYQSLILSSAVLGSVLAVMRHYPLIVFSVIPVIILLMIVCRTGIFKYAGANRIYGYELHLERIKFMKFLNLDDSIKMTTNIYRMIGWEEAQRAWRIVQTAIFRKIYLTPDEDILAIILKKLKLDFINYFRTSLYRCSQETNKLRDDFKKSQNRNKSIEFECPNPKCQSIRNESNTEKCGAYPWFLINDLSIQNVETKPIKSWIRRIKKRYFKDELGDQSTYHAGSYLKNILGMITLMQWLLLAPIGIVPFLALTQESEKINTHHYPPYWLCFAVILIMSWLIYCRKVRIDRRREMLENELLSIHSCCIVWQAVVLAHYCALRKTKGSFKHYTQFLSEEASALRDCTFVIHDWVLSKSKELIENWPLNFDYDAAGRPSPSVGPNAC
jgi:hypothetical protein